MCQLWAPAELATVLSQPVSYSTASSIIGSIIKGQSLQGTAAISQGRMEGEKKTP